ncbi:hypothetical protein AB0E88_11015 [Streptomyces sp. NPDC028635]|uniref:hypothetical protein n=1 Tax=Streptomyces sp. NPDC028635 TaxID=3154800 RepID=UPI0033C92EBB
MAVEQLPGAVREFVGYLDALLGRLDTGDGWCGVFWQRDPDGMRACREGREVPPWDVVVALLQDLAARHGPRVAARESERARALHAAAVTAYDARPGGREALADRLDVMLREQRYAAERCAGLTRALASAATREEADALRVDLAWSRDDHDRATARCAELRARMARRERGQPTEGAGGSGGVRADGPLGAAPAQAGRPAPGAHPPVVRAADGDPWFTADVGAAGTAPVTGSARGRVGDADGQTEADAEGTGAWPRGDVGGVDARAGAGGAGVGGAGVGARAGVGDGDGGPVPANEAGAGGGARGARVQDRPQPGDRGVTAAVGGAPQAVGGAVGRPVREAHAAPFGALSDLAPSQSSAPVAFPDARTGTVTPPPADAPPAPHRVAGAPSQADGPPAPADGPPALPGVPPAQPASQAIASASPGPLPPPSGPPVDAQAAARPVPPVIPKPRKRRRGGARFAGAVDEGDAAPLAEPVPVPQPAQVPVPGAGTGRGLRGARFAGAGEGAEAVPAPEPVDGADRRAVQGAVDRLARLRADGRTGDAHVLLVELARWPAARFPLLAAELHRAGLGADWTTLLWEAASLSAERLVAAADALVAAGRDADGEHILRQGVARPAEEIGAAVRALHTAGRHREVRALLGAYVRVRSPEEAARSAAADPRLLVPLLLEAARDVTDERHWDLLHALRVAGLAH